MSGMYDLVDIEQVKMIMKEYNELKDKVKNFEELKKLNNY
tara:strand:- start:511 stop:630 length:120 start_codon:yes stop_codon:yes gene_type:complete